MQYSMKKLFPITLTVTVLALILTMTAFATHVATVSVSPTDSQIGTDTEFRVLVANQGGDSINSFEIVIPESADLQPLYTVKEIWEPGGWKVNRVYRVDPFRPYKISWTTTSVGIEEGQSLEFVLKAQAPSYADTFTWVWKTVDSKGSIRTGTLATKAGLAPFSTFKITVPKIVKAGEYYQITVAAVDKDGNVKTDFAGSVSFSASDQSAIIPKDYTYTYTDQGSKQFTFKFKTAGDQTVTIKSSDMVVTSNSFYVKPGDTTSIKVSLEKSSVASGDLVEVKVFSIDNFDNELDVTSKATFQIDKESGGKFVNNFYKAEKLGKWTVIATYYSTGLIFKDGASLTVAEQVVPIPTEPTPNVTIPEVPKPVVEEKPAEVKKELTISTLESIVAEPGKTVNFNVTVKNTGNVDLSNVAIQSSGVPETWIASVPTFINIPAEKSQNYLMSISVPETETGVKILTLTVKSIEGVNASKTLSLSIDGKGGITGLFFAILTKPLYIGLIIVVLIIIILIIWKLVPSRSTRKKSEE